MTKQEIKQLSMDELIIAINYHLSELCKSKAEVSQSHKMNDPFSGSGSMDMEVINHQIKYYSEKLINLNIK